MKIGGFAIVFLSAGALLAGALLAGALTAAVPAQAKRSSHRPAYASPPAAPVYGAPAAPVRSGPVWGADGYRFDPPAGAVPFAPSPYGY